MEGLGYFEEVTPYEKHENEDRIMRTDRKLGKPIFGSVGGRKETNFMVV